jgi:hypothetical protein
MSMLQHSLTFGSSTYDLFATLDMLKVPLIIEPIDKVNRAKNLVPEPPKGSLIPYWYSDDDHQPTNFNGIQYFGKVPEGKKRGPYNIMGVPERYVTLDLNNAESL